jgi:hypothetical protein
MILKMAVVSRRSHLIPIPQVHIAALLKRPVTAPSEYALGKQHSPPKSVHPSNSQTHEHPLGLHELGVMVGHDSAKVGTLSRLLLKTFNSSSEIIGWRRAFGPPTSEHPSPHSKNFPPPLTLRLMHQLSYVTCQDLTPSPSFLLR